MTKRRILWFANTPCGASETLDPHIKVGGWLKSLDEVLSNSPEIELHVSFYWKCKLAPFQVGSTFYHPILRLSNRSLASRIWNRLSRSQNQERLEIKEIVKIVHEVKPELIHVHGTEDNFGLVREHTSLPVIVSIQGLLLPYKEKYFSGIPLSIASRVEPVRAKLTSKSIVRQFGNFCKAADRERRILRGAKYVIGRTDWDRRALKITAPKAKYYVGNEIIRKSFYANSWNGKTFNKPLKIVTTMSGGLYKGLETLMQTAKLLSELDFPFQWCVVGQTDESPLAKIVTRWLGYSFQELNVNMMGGMNEDELLAQLLNSDVYCQVSHIENSPNSVCEAMLLGMPVIASFAGGTDSILENRKEGILVQDGDPYALAGAIVEMSLNFESAKQMGQNAKVKAHARHSAGSVCEEYLLVYREILADEIVEC